MTPGKRAAKWSSRVASGRGAWWRSRQRHDDWNVHGRSSPDVAALRTTNKPRTDGAVRVSSRTTLAPVLDELGEKIVPMLRPYASRIELFGSFARGEQRPDSDIDLLIRLRPSEERPPLGLRWFGLEGELSELLGRPVEMTTEEGLSRHIRPSVESDRIILYEE